MTLEDFEKELAENKGKESHRESHTKRDRSHSRDRYRHHRSKDEDKHRHHHRSGHSSRHHSSKHNDEARESRHRHKRSRREVDDDNPERKRKHKKDRSKTRSPDPEEDAYIEKGTEIAPPGEEILDKRIQDAQEADLKRDLWMEAPSALDVDYVQREKKSESRGLGDAQDAFERKIHKNEINHHLRDLKEEGDDKNNCNVEKEHIVNYEFGDPGSQWRMTKLKNVYRMAKANDRPVEEIAEKQYGDLRLFDDAREEEVELDRRQMYGKDYVGKIRPSGELYQERLAEEEKRRPRRRSEDERQDEPLPQGEIMREKSPAARTVLLDQNTMNKMAAQVLKAKMKKDPKAAELEAEYNAAMASFINRKDPEMVFLGAMDSRMLTDRKAEVKTIDNKRGRERGLVEENEDMSIEDMVRQEKRTRGVPGGDGRAFAERIAKDAKFDNDLDYMDENANKLAKRIQKSEINLRNTAISEVQKMTRILDSCPLCFHEDTDKPPVAPVISLATRTYLTLPTHPEVSEGGACIIPIQHRTNLLECDDDEWEEIRNFMKSLTRMYHDQGRDVIFYENAATPHRKRHAAMMVVPLPYRVGETIPAFFKEAILAADEEWTQHKKLIDTLKKSREGLGKLAFRRTIAKEMPYFHVWFELDGGLGHIVEDSNRWPKGDLFARDIIGGILDVGPEVIKRQGRWERGGDRRVEGFKKRWRKFDWTRILTEGQ
ncbi:hypothetical protein M501DRAFT_1013805 [Patellaria atrata CBS 101060]|uniref:Cell cycle control protein cwf19 n=1 Tax=Patellaria atrata CBS 101060 TaxID=1346257 RepID=A0A9P4SIL0_9PEZI|nr:hypothetical protein M501DRAFT_1013805 [Patellaria atrata CBS 101060]